LALGADFAYVGTKFIATEEANASPGYKQMIIDSTADDIMYSATFTGVNGNYLRPSVEAAGLNPDEHMSGSKDDMNFSTSAIAKKDNSSKAWKDIWGSGQGIGSIKNAPSVEDTIWFTASSTEGAFFIDPIP
jgi:nitronate monooxygenase